VGSGAVGSGAAGILLTEHGSGGGGAAWQREVWREGWRRRECEVRGVGPRRVIEQNEMQGVGWTNRHNVIARRREVWREALRRREQKRMLGCGIELTM
jgi:hypothetical protein